MALKADLVGPIRPKYSSAGSLLEGFTPQSTNAGLVATYCGAKRLVGTNCAGASVTLINDGQLKVSIGASDAYREPTEDELRDVLAGLQAYLATERFSRTERKSLTEFRDLVSYALSGEQLAVSIIDRAWRPA